MEIWNGQMSAGGIRSSAFALSCALVGASGAPIVAVGASAGGLGMSLSLVGLWNSRKSSGHGTHCASLVIGPSLKQGDEVAALHQNFGQQLRRTYQEFFAREAAKPLRISKELLTQGSFAFGKSKGIIQRIIRGDDSFDVDSVDVDCFADYRHETPKTETAQFKDLSVAEGWVSPLLRYFRDVYLPLSNDDREALVTRLRSKTRRLLKKLISAMGLDFRNQLADRLRQQGQDVRQAFLTFRPPQLIHVPDAA